MVGMDTSILELVRLNRVSKETALRFASRPEPMKKRLAACPAEGIPPENPSERYPKGDRPR
jgi:hypothetical protein